MKTIPLRRLLREPIKVKKWTRAGDVVRVTDNGQPLWVIQGVAPRKEDEAERKESIRQMLDEMLRQPKSSVSLSRLIKESRR